MPAVLAEAGLTLLQTFLFDSQEEAICARGRDLADYERLRLPVLGARCVQEWPGTLSAVGRCACRVLVLASGATVSAQGL